jgi:DNA polymerase-3 subunit delta'
VSDLIGHGAIRRELWTLAARPEPPHALLFAGPEGLGRTRLAQEFAAALNCEARTPSLFGPSEPSPPCGSCRPCRLIAAGAHPDVLVLEPGDALCRPRSGESGHERHPTSRDIRICQVRGVIDLVSRYPLEARYRVIIVEPAERLGREAQPALLKTLEEPPAHTCFVLVTAAPEAVSETIRSRCRRIDVRPVPAAELQAALEARGLAPEQAAAIAEAARGRPAVALAYAERPDLLEDRARLAERCRSLAEAPDGARLAYAAELAERYRRDRQLVEAELDAWEAYWEGALRTAAQAGDRSAARRAIDALRAVARARADLLANVQPRLAFDLMLLRCGRRTLASNDA